MSYDVLQAANGDDGDFRKFSDRAHAMWYYHREGFIVGVFECEACGHRMDTFIDPRIVVTRFPTCDACGFLKTRFMSEIPTAPK